MTFNFFLPHSTKLVHQPKDNFVETRLKEQILGHLRLGLLLVLSLHPQDFNVRLENNQLSFDLLIFHLRKHSLKPCIRRRINSSSSLLTSCDEKKVRQVRQARQQSEEFKKKKKLKNQVFWSVEDYLGSLYLSKFGCQSIRLYFSFYKDTEGKNTVNRLKKQLRIYFLYSMERALKVQGSRKRDFFLWDLFIQGRKRLM